MKILKPKQSIVTMTNAYFLAFSATSVQNYGSILTTLGRHDYLHFMTLKWHSFNMSMALFLVLLRHYLRIRRPYDVTYDSIMTTYDGIMTV